LIVKALQLRKLFSAWAVETAQPPGENLSKIRPASKARRHEQAHPANPSSGWVRRKGTGAKRSRALGFWHALSVAFEEKRTCSGKPVWLLSEHRFGKVGKSQEAH